MAATIAAERVLFESVARGGHRSHLGGGGGMGTPQTPPPSMTDLVLGGQTPPSMTDLARGGEVRAKFFYAPAALLNTSTE